MRPSYTTAYLYNFNIGRGGERIQSRGWSGGEGAAEEDMQERGWWEDQVGGGEKRLWEDEGNQQLREQRWWEEDEEGEGNQQLREHWWPEEDEEGEGSQQLGEQRWPEEDEEGEWNQKLREQRWPEKDEGDDWGSGGIKYRQEAEDKMGIVHQSIAVGEYMHHARSGSGYGDSSNYALVHPGYLYGYEKQHLYRPLLTPISSLSLISPILYRVYDDCSVSRHQWFGFSAGLQFMPNTPLQFQEALQRHVDWKCRLTTPFISMTDSPHAVDWQVSIREKVNRRNIMIALIDTAVLLRHCGTSIWEMRNAMDHYSVSPPGRLTLSSFDDEYICALEIPSIAIIRLCTPLDFRLRALEYLQVKYMSSLGDEQSGLEYESTRLQTLQQRPTVATQTEFHFF